MYPIRMEARLHSLHGLRVSAAHRPGSSSWANACSQTTGDVTFLGSLCTVHCVPDLPWPWPKGRHRHGRSSMGVSPNLFRGHPKQNQHMGMFLSWFPVLKPPKNGWPPKIGPPKKKEPTPKTASNRPPLPQPSAARAASGPAVNRRDEASLVDFRISVDLDFNH